LKKAAPQSFEETNGSLLLLYEPAAALVSSGRVRAAKKKDVAGKWGWRSSYAAGREQG